MRAGTSLFGSRCQRERMESIALLGVEWRQYQNHSMALEVGSHIGPYEILKQAELRIAPGG